jgi:hypothetical protein
MSGTVDTMPVLVTPADVAETWLTGGKDGAGKCAGGQIASLPGSLGGGAWVGMHMSELSSSPIIGGFPAVFVIKDWIQDTEQSVKKEYHGTKLTIFTEDTVLRITATE